MKFRSIFVAIVNQTLFTGVHALPMVAFIALLIGATVIIQAMTALPEFGVEGFLGNLMVVVVGRELGPLITALIVITRSGSAITAEIATQQQSGEIFALELMGIDTKLYMVFPRIMASILAIFSLIIIFDLVAFAGGFAISQLLVYLPIDVYAQTLLDTFSIEDALSTIIKSLIYGILVPIICCYYGFMPKAKFEVPIFVSRAVIRTFAIIFIINVIVSVMFYL
jgi:phospholipid/cholesterol/gamma-HCH transport system permease protein